MTPAVSVVIPTADRREILLETLACVLRQTVVPAEVLIIDNGREATLLADLPAHVSVVRTAPRIGPSAARNAGARAARSEIVAFLDDDDLWLPDYLERILERFDETGADAVVGQLMRKRQGAEPTAYKLFPEEPEQQRRVFLRNPGFGGQNLAIRRAVFLELGGFDERLPASEDRDLAARLLLSGRRIAVAPQAVAILCDHGGGRARGNRHTGNKAFFQKHWRNMRPGELLRAIGLLCKRRLAMLDD
ncbi:MAG: glycosyltransferase family 2 protein [Deltaproteobacteria bacterium]|nr:MAG: glycosyltransferase family 2 protein [Deltaproteobacteria bacterium]